MDRVHKEYGRPSIAASLLPGANARQRTAFGAQHSHLLHATQHPIMPRLSALCLLVVVIGLVFPGASLPVSSFASSGRSSPDQQRLLDSSTAAYRRGQFTKLAQDGSVCPSAGEKQWTGTVDVADDRRLFYWFVDSRSDPARDPVILWLNG